MIKILGIDPGISTGLAMIHVDDKKMRLENAKVSEDQTAMDYYDWIKEADIVVVEDFLVRPKKAQQGAFDNSRMITVKIIGAISTLARINGKEIVLQPSSIKPIGYGFAKMKYFPGKRAEHIHTTDAAAHVAYYAVRQNLALPGKLL